MMPPDWQSQSSSELNLESPDKLFETRMMVSQRLLSLMALSEKCLVFFLGWPSLPLNPLTVR
jgi:hypothetical protein